MHIVSKSGYVINFVRNCEKSYATVRYVTYFPFLLIWLTSLHLYARGNHRDHGIAVLEAGRWSESVLWREDDVKSTSSSSSNSCLNFVVRDNEGVLDDVRSWYGMEFGRFSRRCRRCASCSL